MRHSYLKKTGVVLAAALLVWAAGWAAVSGNKALRSPSKAPVPNEASNTEKFHVDVTGYSGAPGSENRVPVVVSADVYGDYHFDVALPAPGSDGVGADKATVNVRMTGVQSLGLEPGETRSYSKTVETGLSLGPVALSGALDKAYNFGGARINVTVKDKDNTHAFDYNIAGRTSDYHIVGTPSDEATARAAWQLITSKVSAGQDLSDDDTHFLFKKGAYITIGDETLVFDEDYDFLKGAADLGTLFSAIRPYVHVQKSGLSGQAANKAVVYLPEGSTLGISSSNAVLTEDAILTVDATDKPDLNITGKLSGLRDQLLRSGSGATTVAIAYAVNTFNEVIGLVDEADNVPVTLEFKKKKFHVDVTGYSGAPGSENRVPVAVNADVYDDYHFDVALPAPGSDSLGADKATVNVRMTGVQSLGLEPGETRSYSKTLEMGFSLSPLSRYFDNVYNFDGATINVTVKDKDNTQAFDYNIAGRTSDYHIVGTPSDEATARAAWQLITSKVSASQDLSDDDTHFLFKKGAYITIGDETLVFDEDYDFLKDDLGTLFSAIHPYGHVQKSGLSGQAANKAVVYLPEGSTLGISSNAVLTEDAILTVDATDKPDLYIGGFLSRLRDFFQRWGSYSDATAFATFYMLRTFNEVIGLVDAGDNVPVTLEFKKHRTPKFHLDVTGYAPADGEGNRAPVAVNADVYSDYGFVVSLPDVLNDQLGADKATLHVSMTGVQTLGLQPGETRSYEKTVETGVGGISVPLSNFLTKTYAFEGATCPVKVITDEKTESFVYNIDGINSDYQIVGTPDDSTKARAAWHLLTSKVTSQSGVSPEDTHFLFKKGAYLQVGDERLVFLSDFDFLKGSATLESLFADAQTRIEKVNVSGANTVKAVAYLPAGSTLGLSSSAASVTEDCYVTVDGSSKAGTYTLTDFFSNLKSSGTVPTALAIKVLVEYFDAAVGLVDTADGVEFTVEFKKPRTPKFHLDVTGYAPADGEGNRAPVAVNADVYSDYGFVVSLPDVLNDQLGADKATLHVSMTGVQTLGLQPGETRSYEKTVETGVGGISVPLSNFLTETYAFEGATCPVKVITDEKTESFVYNIDGINSDYQIVGTPDDSTKARAAWHLLTSKVTSQSGVSPEDTHFLFKKGAYLQVGDERLVFDTDYDFFKGSASIEDLFNGIRPAVHVAKVNSGEGIRSDLPLKTAQLYLPAGSTLGMGGSAASVKEDCYVTIDGSRSSIDDSKFKGLLSGYRDNVYKNGSANKQVAIALLVKYFDEVIGLVNNASMVPVTVEFKTLVIDGNNDVDNWENTVSSHDGDVVNVRFTRTMKADGGWYTLCLPMDLTDEQLKEAFGDDYYLEAYKDNEVSGSNNAVFNFERVHALKAGQPYLLMLSKDFESKVFQDVKINADGPEKVEFYVNGDLFTFTGTAQYNADDLRNFNGLARYLGGANGTTLRKVASTSTPLKPTRCYFIFPSVSTEISAKLNIGGSGVTSIDNIRLEEVTSDRIYMLGGQYVGRSLNGLAKGVYIVNGKKIVKR